MQTIKATSAGAHMNADADRQAHKRQHYGDLYIKIRKYTRRI